MHGVDNMNSKAQLHKYLWDLFIIQIFIKMQHFYSDHETFRNHLVTWYSFMKKLKLRTKHYQSGLKYYNSNSMTKEEIMCSISLYDPSQVLFIKKTSTVCICMVKATICVRASRLTVNLVWPIFRLVMHIYRERTTLS